MQIKVFLNQQSTKPVYERIVPCNNSVEFDFSTVLRSMKILYGSDCIVEFKTI